MLNQEGFDLWADGYDKTVDLSDQENTYPFAGYQQILYQICQCILRAPGRSVLDIGFGTGTLTARLYDQGCTIYGQDFSESMIRLAKEKMPLAQLYQGDFTEGLVAPLRQQRYDAIVATYSLHHLTNPQKIVFLRQLQELLNPGGCIYIGDVAFSTQAELDACQAKVGSEWDEDEIYFVYDELHAQIPALKFQQISSCSGILTLER